MEKIKIRELSIGDWVRYDFPEIGKRNIQVNSIDEEDNHIGAGGVGASVWSDVSVFEPIRLTPAILEKNGFEKNSKSPLYANYSYADNICVGVYKNGCVRVEVYSNDGMQLVAKAVIKYTHQLQHALRLAGVRKEIEL